MSHSTRPIDLTTLSPENAPPYDKTTFIVPDDPEGRSDGPIDAGVLRPVPK